MEQPTTPRPSPQKFRVVTSGILELAAGPITLSELEAFCAKARQLGLGDQARLSTDRQGLLGPVSGWYFDIPVTPKREERS